MIITKNNPVCTMKLINDIRDSFSFTSLAESSSTLIKLLNENIDKTQNTQPRPSSSRTATTAVPIQKSQSKV